MKKIEASDLLDLTNYEKQRDDYRRRMMALKGPRRVAVGDALMFIFENRDTVRFQIQEMVRVERIVDDEKIQLELDVYNELIPGPHELSATLMIEVTENEMIRPTLDRLIGIDEHIFLRIGDQSVKADFDEKQFEEDRISAVQYIRFPLGSKLAEAFADPESDVALIVDHPAYRSSAVIVGDTRQSLLRDLQE
ncbi:MAG: DUF3501 family protein [bacterium]|nr:DUF3501 family protein [bacterium]